MKNIRIILFALALALTASPAFASSLGVAGDYNAFVFGDFNATSDTEGKLAVGHDATLTNYSVGLMLPHTNTNNVLVVGNDLTFNGGSVYGDTHVGGNTYGSGFTPQRGGAVTSGTPINFGAMETYYQNLSTQLGGLQSVAAVTQYGGMHLTGTNSSLEVFNIAGSDLMNSTWVSLTSGSFNPDATIIINVSGTTGGGLTNMGLQQLGAFTNKVLFNFYEATQLDFSGVGILGSVLAPYAHIDANNGVLVGTLIAQSFDGAMQLDHAPFEGSTPTPIPGSIALLGTGLAGLVAWRRRR